MDRIKKIGPIKALTVLSILILLSGMAAMTSADGWPSQPNEFYGTVTLNGADAPVGTVINAYIDGELSGTIDVTTSGEYGEMPDLDYLKVNGNESEDEGKTITFTVCGAAADQTVTWSADELPRELDLTAVDDVAPAVTDATATPSSIVANGADTTQLTVTVIDGCGVGSVTVNLSDIGGSAVQAMAPSGGDTYSTDTTASVDTPPRTHYLYVNASDVFGNCNTSVCIDLEVTSVLIGDLNGDNKVNIDDLILLGQAWGTYPGEPGYNSAADINEDGEIDIDDLILLGQSWTG
jgi:hypothetical protein